MPTRWKSWRTVGEECALPATPRPISSFPAPGYHSPTPCLLKISRCGFHMQERSRPLIFLSLVYLTLSLLPSISADGRMSCFVKADWCYVQYFYLLSFISPSVGEVQMPPGGAANSTTLNIDEQILPHSKFAAPASGYLLATLAEYPSRHSLGKEGFLLAYSSKVQSFMVGRSWCRECKAPGHLPLW